MTALIQFKFQSAKLHRNSITAKRDVKGISFGGCRFMRAVDRYVYPVGLFMYKRVKMLRVGDKGFIGLIIIIDHDSCHTLPGAGLNGEGL